jgi:crotonobetainyl-CoA:carnitine CoA-transferase CaiB-like acyl-CoA transferase
MNTPNQNKPNAKKSGARPLDHITVVSLEHAIAAPFCTRQLADLGARVIKVERPVVGDFARAYDQRARGERVASRLSATGVDRRWNVQGNAD